MNRDNILSVLNDTDSYKLGHFKQYPEGTTAMSSYFESRGGEHKKTLFFGLQYLLKKYLNTPVTKEDVEYMKDFSARHGLSFNYDGWMHIVNRLGGYLPVKIRAVAEGSIIPTGNVLMDVTSTDEKSFWVVSWLETILSRLWYPITVATKSHYTKRMIQRWLSQTGTINTYEESLFRLHDFGSRGTTCQEQAMIGGAAHLISFRGSDTIAGIEMAHRYYDCPMAGFSIEASEHSTMTMLGEEGEVDQFRNMIKQYGGNEMFACVSDSYDIYRACTEIWGRELQKDVMSMNATLIVRPDSGDPVDTTLEVVKRLFMSFGGETSNTGHIVLNGVRVIWGDGIVPEDINSILRRLAANGFAAENVAFGMGGGLLQKCDRDTQRFAFKASWAKIKGEEVSIYKEPITDKGKNSKRGRLDLINFGGSVSTCEHKRFSAINSLLVPVFENGKILKTYTFDEIRENAGSLEYEQYKGWKDRPEPWEQHKEVKA